jgi:hypothetical protein
MSLRHNVGLYLRRTAPVVAVLLHLGRLAGLVAGWVLVARVGRAPGLLEAFVGFLISRPIVATRSKRGAT